MPEQETIIIHETKNGFIFKYRGCRIIHVEFGNILWQFEPEDFKNFRAFIDNLEIKKLEKLNHKILNRRKVFIQMKNSRQKLVFHVDEVLELRKLLSGFGSKNGDDDFQPLNFLADLQNNKIPEQYSSVPYSKN